MWINKKDGTQESHDDCDGDKKIFDCNKSTVRASCFAMKGVPIPLMLEAKSFKWWIEHDTYYRLSDFLNEKLFYEIGPF